MSSIWALSVSLLCHPWYGQFDLRVVGWPQPPAWYPRHETKGHFWKQRDNFLDLFETIDSFLTSVGFPFVSYLLALGHRLDHAKSLGDSRGSVRSLLVGNGGVRELAESQQSQQVHV